MPGQFAGKVVLVTGGSAGIGRVTARVLARLGATVVVAPRLRDLRTIRSLKPRYTGLKRTALGRKDFKIKRVIR
jgi:NAD(P)-dependent dehydrogenase (short-subunit alcohol dehydrogenase family)